VVDRARPLSCVEGRAGKKSLGVDHLRNLGPRFRFLQRLNSQARLLDLGCGSFKTLKRLREQRPDLEYYGVDIMDVAAACPPGVIFARADIDHEKLPFGDSFFDAIFFCHVLEHLHYPMTTLAEIQRVLKPGGHIYIEGPSTRTLFLPSLSFIQSSGSLKAVGDDLNFYDNFTHVRPLSKRSLHMFLELANCDVATLGHVRSPLKTAVAPFLVLSGLLAFKRRWVCVGLWELVGWSVYAVGKKMATPKSA
jgi:SAM-dependent methyltransferase